MAREKKYRRFSLVRASENHRHHEVDSQLPRVSRIKNCYPAVGDACPMLRSSMSGMSTTALAENITATLTEFQIGYVTNATGQLVSFTNLAPWTGSGATKTIASSVYSEGSVVVNTGTTTVTGTSTNFLREVWVGCWVLFSGDTNYYEVASITSDTVLVLATNKDGNYSGSAYEVYRTHNRTNVRSALNIEEFGNWMLYSVNRPTSAIAASQISGPFVQKTQALASYTWAVDYPIAAIVAIECDGTNWVRSGPNTDVQYTTDPSGSWSNSGGIAASPAAITLAEGGKWLAIDSTVAYLSSDGTAATFVDGDAVDLEMTVSCTAVRYDAAGGVGGNCYVAVGPDNIDVSEDLTGNWTNWSRSGGWEGVDFGSRWVVVGRYGKVTVASDPTDTWQDEESSTDEHLWAVACSSTVDVAVGSRNTILRNVDASGWEQAASLGSPPAVHWNDVRWTGTYFLATGWAGNQGFMYYSQDGDKWYDLATSQPDGNPMRLGCPKNAAMDNIYAYSYSYDASSSSHRHLGHYASVDATPEVQFGDFQPISDAYRARAFCVAGSPGYVMLACVLEWDEQSSTWQLHTRRVRWTSPGTVQNFDGEGATFLDCPGVGALRDIHSLGSHCVLLEENGIGLLSHTGNLDSPWFYRKLKTGIFAVSNGVVWQNRVWFIGNTGHLYAASASGVEEVGTFDIEPYIEGRTINDTILGYEKGHACLFAFEHGQTAPFKLYMISPEMDAVTHFQLPVYDDDDTDLDPQHVFPTIDPEVRRLAAAYAQLSTDDTKTYSSYVDAGAVSTGVDTLDTGITVPYHAVIEGGQEELVREGLRAIVSEVELDTYSNNTNAAVNPDLTFEVQAEHHSSWVSGGTDVGTANITSGSTTIAGTTTAWSHILGEDSGTVFTTPRPAALCSYTKLTGGSHTALVETTDYTISGTHQVTLVVGLVAGTDLNAQWLGSPVVTTAANDYFIGATSDNAYRISSIETATSATLATTPTATEAAVHVPAGQIPDESGEVILGVGSQVGRFRWKIRIIPRGSGKADAAKVSSFVITYSSLGRELKKDS